MSRIMRGSYSGNTLAFQANAESSILLPRSTQIAWLTGNKRRPMLNICGGLHYAKWN